MVALLGGWHPGVIAEITDDDAADASKRVAAQLYVSDPARGGGGQLVSTTLARRSLVSLDSGDSHAFAKLKRGAPLVVWEDGEWMNALLIAWPSEPGGKTQLMGGDGSARRNRAPQPVTRTQLATPQRQPVTHTAPLLIPQSLCSAPLKS